MKAFLTKILIRAIGCLPLSVSRAAGSGLARLCWLSQDRNSKVTRENIELCFPTKSPEEQELLAKRSLIETGRLTGETFTIWNRCTDWQEQRVRAIHGEDIIQSAVADNNGVIVMAPHLGNWEFLGGRLVQYGPVTCLYQPQKKQHLEDIIVNCRAKQGIKLQPTNTKGVCGLLNALRASEIVGILPDQCPDMGGDFSPFYNNPAYTMTLIYKLVQKTQCRVVCGVAVRCKGGFEIHFIEPPKSIYSERQDESLAALNKAVEKCITVAPEQYQWEYKRFKKHCPGEPQRYCFKK